MPSISSPTCFTIRGLKVEASSERIRVWSGGSRKATMLWSVCSASGHRRGTSGPSGSGGGRAPRVVPERLEDGGAALGAQPPISEQPHDLVVSHHHVPDVTPRRLRPAE